MRWLYHSLPRHEAIRALSGTTDYAPASLASEGFVHASYVHVARASAELYVKDDPVALSIDPRRIAARIDVASTPRGPMPHVHGPIPRDAIRDLVELADLAAAPDRVQGTRFAFVALEGMTLLDLVGALDPVARIVTMGFDPTARVDVIAGTPASETWSGFGARFCASVVRPSLGAYDVVVIPGGPGVGALTKDDALLRWLAEFPTNRLSVSVCTGSLLWAAEGRLRGKSATTHATALADLAALGATARAGERVVADEGVLTGGGVTAAIDVGLALVLRYAGKDAHDAIARQMEIPRPDLA